MSPIADNVTGGIIHSCYDKKGKRQWDVCFGCAERFKYYGRIEGDIPEDEYRWFLKLNPIYFIPRKKDFNQIYKPIIFCPYCGEKLE